MPDLLFHIFPNENFIDLCLYQYGYEKCDPGHSFGPAARNHYLFHYILTGTGTLLADDTKGVTQTYQIRSGQGFMIFPGQVTTYIADSNVPWEYIWVEFDGLRITEALSMTDFSKNKPVYHPRNKELRDKLSVMNAKFMGKDESFDPFYGAQELLIVLANKAMPTYLYDGTLVLGNLMNAAADLGVDSCWIHRAKEEFETQEGKELLKSLGIEGDYEGIGHLVLGYAAAPLKEAAPRKADYVYYIR